MSLRPVWCVSSRIARANQKNPVSKKKKKQTKTPKSNQNNHHQFNQEIAQVRFLEKLGQEKIECQHKVKT